MEFILILKHNEKEDYIELKYNTSNNSITNVTTNEKFVFNNITTNNKKRSKKITIQLGFSCNMKCQYCLQSKTELKDFNKDNLDILLDKLNKENLDNTTIEFWGGEPMLYMPDIQYIISNLNVQPENGYLIFTNGILLNNSNLEYLVKNNFTIILSHDAQGQFVRGVDPLIKPNIKANVKWLVENYDKFAINSVITDANIDTRKRLEFFGKRLSVDINKINHSGEGPAYNKATCITNEDLHNNIYLDIMEGNGLAYGFYMDGINTFVKAVNEGRLLDKISTKCGIDNKDYYKVLSTDGKELSCHNYDFKFDIKTFKDSSKCKDCLVANICKSSCPAIDKNSEVFENNCSIMYATHTALLRATFSIELPDYQLIKILKPNSI